MDRLLFGPDQDASLRDFKTYSSDDESTLKDSPVTPSSGTSLSPMVTRLSAWQEKLWLQPTISRCQTLIKREEATWDPKFFQIRPIAGITALCIVLGCIVASLAILIFSNGKTVDSWPIQPTVYLAVVAAIANSALALARQEGVTVSWWYSASRGRTIRSLERQWQITRSLLQALLHSPSMSLLNIACLAGAFVIIDGPLLQRASTVRQGSQLANVTLDLILPQELPVGQSGSELARTLWHHVPLDQANKDWLASDVPIPLTNSTTCDGSCETSVQAPGMRIDHCTTQTWPITSEMLDNFNSTWGPWKKYSDNHKTARLPYFYTELLDLTNGTYAGAESVVGMASWSSSGRSGQFVEKRCRLELAVVEYDVVIREGSLSLPRHPNQGRFVRFPKDVKSQSQQDVRYPRNENNILRSITFWLGIFVRSNATALMMDGDPPWMGDVTTFTPELVRYQTTREYMLHVNFTDPTPDIVARYDEYLFRFAVQAAHDPALSDLLGKDIPITQRVPASQTTTGPVYVSDLRWYAGAAVLELVTAMLVLPMFWGWWTLGCNLSLSPFAIALAFDSPLLKDVNSAAGAKGVVKDLGNMKVKLGICCDGEGGKLSDGMMHDGCYAGRLGVEAMENVVRPRKGTKFRR